MPCESHGQEFHCSEALDSEKEEDFGSFLQNENLDS